MPTDAPAALPFIQLPGASLTSTDTVAFGSVVDTSLPLQVHTWDHPQQGEAFLNRSGSIRLGDLTLLSTWGSAIDGEVEQKREAQLVLPYLAGTNTFQVEGRHFSFRRSCLFIPAARCRIRLHCTTCSGVIFSFLNALMRGLGQQVDPFQSQVLRDFFGLLVLLVSRWQIS